MSRSPSRRRVVGYLRVSTDRQAEEGLGLEVQADAIKAKFAHGVLEVGIPKQPVVAAKRVTVEAA